MNKKGITVIEMVIVVMILILLAIMAIWSSQKPNLEAELAVVNSEFKGVYLGISKIKTEYESEIFDEYESGVHYNEKAEDDGWYIIYGLEDAEKYDENVIKNLGVSELKRSYKVNFDTLQVELLKGPVKVGEYEVNTYEDVKELLNSGVI